MILFDQYSTEDKVVLYVNSPQEITAYGMSADDVISVEIALIGAMEPNFVSVGCSLIDNSNQPYPIEAVAPYVVCGCPVRAKIKSPRFVIKRPGAYIITYTGSGFGDAVVESKNATAEAIEQFEHSCESLCDECEDTSWAATGETRCKNGNVEEREASNCGNVRWTIVGPETWTPTGDTRCNNFLVEIEEVNDCGTTRWTPTAEACGFCASYPVPLDQCEGQSAYAYRSGDVKDPLATVELADCDSDESVWVYPSEGPGHSIPVYDCDGAVLGYGANTSDCVANEVIRTQIIELPPLEIAKLPELKIERHLVEAIQVGNEVWTYWSDGVKEIEYLPVDITYCPSLRISCDGNVGFGYHINDPKDPKATIEMAPCSDDTSVDSAWIYPTSGPGHTVKVVDCDGTIVGYAANRSDCAPECGCTNVSN